MVKIRHNSLTPEYDFYEVSHSTSHFYKTKFRATTVDGKWHMRNFISCQHLEITSSFFIQQFIIIIITKKPTEY